MSASMFQRKKKASKYKGVYRCGFKWKAQIQSNGIQHYLGVFDTEAEAANVYNQVSSQLHPHLGTKCNITELVRETMKQRKSQFSEEFLSMTEYTHGFQVPRDVDNSQSAFEAARVATVTTSSDDVNDVNVSDPLLPLKLRLGQVIRLLSKLNNEVIVNHSIVGGGVPSSNASTDIDGQIVALLQEQRELVGRILAERTVETAHLEYRSNAYNNNNAGYGYHFTGSSNSSFNSSSSDLI